MLILIIPAGLFLHLILKEINHEARIHEPAPIFQDIHENRVQDAREEHQPCPDAGRDPSVMRCPASNPSTCPARGSSISE